MKDLKGTKTLENLMTAFSGESEARNKYTYYASKAKKDGFVQIQKIFEETAGNEKEHVPVKIKDGESPVKGGGKLFIIDGGISKAYQKTTGIAGYTFIYNSRFMALAEHKPYEPLQKDGTQVFHSPTMRTVEVMKKRMTVRDTDQGMDLQRQIDELRELVEAYKEGRLKEKY